MDISKEGTLSEEAESPPTCVPSTNTKEPGLGNLPEHQDGAELENDFKINSDLSFLKDSSTTSTPSENFKSSYAKSLADSYRRASLPVVVSAPKGQFYFNNEEVISLNSSYLNQNRYPSLSSNLTTAPSSQSYEPSSLPSTFEKIQQNQQPPSSNNFSNSSVDDISVFVPYETIQILREKNDGDFAAKDQANFSGEVVFTNDGRKLVMLKGYRELWRRKLAVATRNGEAIHMNPPEKEAQAEGLRLEYNQLESRVQQLCEVLADRDTTIQRLEEDLLRMRMECQRLMVDNRSLKSTVSPTGLQPSVVESTCEVQKLKQHVELLTAQLDKAERSRRTYETATRQLVDFLHTVNTTLSSSNTNVSTPPQSGSSFRSSTVNLQSDSDHSFESAKRNPDLVQRAESVYALPTHTGNRPRVNRSVSTYCVASVQPAKESGTSSVRMVNSEYLVTRAKELIASLKSLTRNESVMKLNIEPKKPGSAMANSSGVSLRSYKREGFSDNSLSPTSSHHLQISQDDDSIGSGTESHIQTQAQLKLNDNSQPLSLVVVGEASSNSVEHGFSSLPINGCVSRIHNDSEQRLVWV